MLYLHNRIIFSLKKKGNPDTYYSINLENIILSEISQRENTVRFHVNEVPRTVKFINTEEYWWLPGEKGRVMRSYYLVGIEFQFGLMKKF